MRGFVPSQRKTVQRVYKGAGLGIRPISLDLLQLIAQFDKQGIACKGVNAYDLDRLLECGFIGKNKERAFITPSGKAWLQSNAGR